MTYRKILVPVVGQARDHAALQVATRIARDFGSHIVALFVRPSPADALPMVGFGYTGPALASIIDAAMRVADANATEARKTFDEVMREANIPLSKQPGPQQRPTADFVIVEDHFVEAIDIKARLSDMVVVQGFAPSDVLAMRTAIESAVLSGQPILIAPEQAPAHVGERVAVAFDGTSAAAHGVKAAIPLLTRAKAVELISVAEAPKSTAQLDALKAYLALRGIDATETIVDPADRNVSQALFQAAEKARCDLLVMGGYGHARLREIVFGGVTQDVLSSRLSIPVLMAH